MAGLGVSGIPQGTTAAHASSVPSIESLPENPLVLFDNFHAGNRRGYALRARLAAAQNAGFDGFEFVNTDPRSEAWAWAMDLVPATNLSVWGFHWTTRAVIDKHAPTIDAEIEKIQAIIEVLGQSPLKPYMSMSLSGTDELGGPTIHESGSAKAEPRHWERAYKIVAAYDAACRAHGIRGALYPHTHWICDTPQSVVKILDGAEAQTLGPAFCSHHWYANRASDALDDVLGYPLMQRLNYVVMTNGRFQGNRFPAVRWDRGEIDMAWLLAKLYDFGYTGPISSQGWAIGGDPFVACQTFVDGMRALRHRFKTQPELWPLLT
ncbi:MAG: hypothetical protein RhofKO_37030 [Rhodothermales bacterium]